MKLNIKKEKTNGMITKPWISNSGLVKLTALAFAGVISINTVALSLFSKSGTKDKETKETSIPSIEATLNNEDGLNLNDRTFKLGDLKVLATKNGETGEVYYQIVSFDITKETYNKDECEKFLCKIFDLGDEDFYNRESFMYINDYKSVMTGEIVYRQMSAHIEKVHDSRVFTYIYKQNTLILDGDFSNGLWQIETNRYGDVLDIEDEEDPVKVLIDETSYTVNSGEEVFVADNQLYDVKNIDLSIVLGEKNLNTPISLSRIRELENKLNKNTEDFMGDSKTI